MHQPHPQEGRAWVVPKDRDDAARLRALGPTPVLDRWHPVPVQLLTEDGGAELAPADLPWLGGHGLVLTARARWTLEPLLRSDAELLPLACVEEDLWFVHVLRVIDALDVERSDIVRFRSSGRIMAVRRPVLKLDAVGDARCFVPTELEGRAMFVAQEIVDAVLDAGLTGVDFVPVDGT